MTADEFYNFVLLCRRSDRFIIETYTIRHIPHTPWETLSSEDAMLRRARIMYYGMLEQA